VSELLKAWKSGKRGKFRRVDGGKLKFIRSEDGVVEKEAGVTTTAGMVEDMGEPAAGVALTDKPKVKCPVCGLAKCNHAVKKSCGCKVEECDCERSKVEVPTTMETPEHVVKIDDLIKMLEEKLG
jgi:hypothetical protein